MKFVKPEGDIKNPHAYAREVLELDESSLRARRHSTLISMTQLIFT